VAAKTGTAQIETASGQFVATNDWMIAFAPASAPKVAVAVELLHQPVSGTGAANAGPVMATMIQDALAELSGSGNSTSTTSSTTTSTAPGTTGTSG
jgi:cell division protein FtsI/penicillin-binding protein 2